MARALFILLLAVGSSVTSVHEARFRLMVQNDLAALAPLLADDLVYIHSDATVESKQQFLDRLRGGGIRYNGIDPSETKVRTAGAVAIITGRAKMSVTMGGADRQLDMRYTSVYRRARGRWQLISWQSTRLP